MSRPRGGVYTDEKSKPIAFRLPNELIAAAIERAEGIENLNAWAREVIRRELQGPPQGLAAAQRQGFDEGKRQGWAHANAVFRKALGVAVAELK
jgi:hypothetical protein